MKPTIKLLIILSAFAALSVLGAAAHADGTSHYGRSQSHAFEARGLTDTASCDEICEFNKTISRAVSRDCAKRMVWKPHARQKIVPRRCIPLAKRPPHVFAENEKIPDGWTCMNTEYYDRKGRLGSLCGPADQLYTSWEHGKINDYWGAAW